MELESIIKQEEIDRLNEAVNLARDLEFRLDKIKEQLFEMANGNKEPERLVKYKDIVEISSVMTLQLAMKPQHHNKLQAINRLMILADYYNEDWEPDWESPSWKYFAVYNKEKGQIQIRLSIYDSHGYVYFKSEQLLQTAIENNREIFEAALK